MTVRVKILAISAILLLLFAVVLVGSVVMQKQSSDKVAAIIDFHLPLAAAIADLDVATYEYELGLEGVNKVYGTTVILAEETHGLAQHAIEARELDVVIVAGKSEPVRIFELVGRAGEVEPPVLELRDLYVEGLEAYRRQDWDAAEGRFTECLRLCPDDGPAGVLRGRSVAFRAAPPPDWDGVWRLAEK